MSAYIFDTGDRIWYRNDYVKRIEYSDGSDIETRIFNSVKNSKDISVLSEELETHIFDWTSLCFLSKRRSNLLRPFASLFNGKHILEVGCGAGPITRFLGECGAFVYAVEPSRRRASIAAERCRDLENVKIFCDDIESFEADRAFDGMVQIGVLEYATKFSNNENAPLNFLTRLKELLTPSGFLITAIENQLGLKYFSGFAEDHAGAIMHGINNNYRAGEATTWGRKSLIAIFEKAGFPRNELFLPFPDYKLPSLVFYPDFTEKNEVLNINLDNILSNLSYQDTQKNVPLFSLDRAFPLVAGNGLLEDLSNSFCLLSSLTPRKEDIDPANLFALYNTERKKEYCKEILFKKTGNSVVVERNPLHLASPPENAVISFEKEEPLFSGTLYSYELVKILNRTNWDIKEVAGWLRGWFDCLQKDVGGDQDLSDVHARIGARYIDAIPINLLVSEKGHRFIDLEVDLGKDVEIGYLVFRAIHVSFSRIASIAVPHDPSFALIDNILYALFSRFGYQLTEDLLDRYFDWEADLASAVSPVKAERGKRSAGSLRTRIPLDSVDSLLHQVQELRSAGESYGLDIERRKAAILELETEIGRLETFIHDRDARIAELKNRTEELSLSDQQEAVRQARHRIAQLEEQARQSDHEIYSLSTSRKRMIKQFVKRSLPFLFKK